MQKNPQLVCGTDLICHKKSQSTKCAAPLPKCQPQPEHCQHQTVHLETAIPSLGSRSQQLAEKTKPPAWNQSCAIPWAVGFDPCHSAEPQTFSSGAMVSNREFTHGAAGWLFLAQICDPSRIPYSSPWAARTLEWKLLTSNQKEMS